MRWVNGLAVVLCLVAALVRAEPVSILRPDAFLSNGAGLVQIGQRAASRPDGIGAGGSLFIGRDGQSFFRPFPVRIRARTGQVMLGLNDGAVARIRDLIASAEAGQAGYDAVQHGARIKTPRRPTDMSIGEIYAWIDATPGQPHAIGRYQFIPATLRRLVKTLALPMTQRFDARTQDRLANVLLAEAGLNAAQRGEISRHTFMHNLAKIWAGLPTASGKSHYHGYAGNKATITWARYDAVMAAALQRP